ncbi:MAG TPA: DUF5698 domain-containing protein [Gemmatimonadales bacterium]|jgi:uncharacterized protein YebE (UPF0316 family)
MSFEFLPIWAVAVLVFSLRILDVSLGTMRTISVVRGHVGLAMMLGFVEVSIWVIAVTQVVAGIAEHPLLVIAYAGGFASGSAVGITLERKLALGSVVVRVVSHLPRSDLEAVIGPLATDIAAFRGEAAGGDRTLLYASCKRRDLPRLIEKVRAADDDVFYVVERFSQMGTAVPLPHPTGWRAVFKMK